MSFLNKFSKSVGKAADQARFEADKMMRTNKLNGEVGAITQQINQATAAIGSKVIELYDAGELQIPDVQEAIAQVKALQAQIAEKKAELEAVKASKYEEGGLPAEAPAAASPESCPECGAPVGPGAKFCPTCGHKMTD